MPPSMRVGPAGPAGPLSVSVQKSWVAGYQNPGHFPGAPRAVSVDARKSRENRWDLAGATFAADEIQERKEDKI